MADQNISKDFTLVCIGASAGGITALKELLAELPSELPPLAMVLLQHTNPSTASKLSQVLKGASPLPVVEVRDGMPIAPGKLYVPPSTKQLLASPAGFELVPFRTDMRAKPNIDRFMHSLAKLDGFASLGIILSGTGNDGAMGMSWLHQAGARLVVQSPKDSRYPGMPLATLSNVENVLTMTAREIGANMDKLVAMPWPEFNSLWAEKQEPMTQEEQLFLALQQRGGLNLYKYRENLVQRAIKKRVDELKLPDKQLYADYFTEHPEEMDLLQARLMVQRSEFYRESASLQAFSEHLHTVVSKKEPGADLRLWVPACSRGQDAYTVGIIAREVMQQQGKHLSLQLFATDVDQEAIDSARQGSFSAEEVSLLPEAWVKTYFMPKKDQQMEVIKSLRSDIIFSQHNLLEHPPFLRLDAVCCRNLFIYLNPSAQNEALQLFNYVLRPKGLLLLGTTERQIELGGLFRAAHPRLPLFQKIKQSGIFSLISMHQRAGQGSTRPLEDLEDKKPAPNPQEVVQQALAESFRWPYMVVNSQQELVESRGDLRPYLTLREGRLSGTLRSVMKDDVYSHYLGLSLSMSQGGSTSTSVTLPAQYGAVQLVIRQSSEAEGWTLLSFESQPLPSVAANDSQTSESNQALAKELEETRQMLQTFIEELETSNEELQSTNEELQTANEELQSSNEELETSNEELQSSNYEMEVAYRQLQEAKDELERKELLLSLSEENTRTLLDNSPQVMVLVDEAMNIVEHNTLAQTFAKKTLGRNLQPGKSVLQLLDQAAAEKMFAAVKESLDGKSSRGETAWHSPKAGKLWLQFSFAPSIDLTSRGKRVVPISFLDVTSQRQGQVAMREAEQVMDTIFESVVVGLFIADEFLTIKRANKGLSQLLGYAPQDLHQLTVKQLFPADTQDHWERTLHELLVNGGSLRQELEVVNSRGIALFVAATVNAITTDEGFKELVFTLRDISENRRFQEMLQGARDATSIGGWEYDPKAEQLTLSQEVQQLLQLPTGQEHLPLKSFLALFRPTSQQVLLQALEKTVKGTQGFDAQLQLLPAKNLPLWVRVTCRPSTAKGEDQPIYGTLQDTTQDKATEKELNKLSLVASRINNAVIITNPTGEIEWVNEGFTKLTGYTLSEVAGRNARMLQGPDTDPDTVARIRKWLENEEAFTEEILNYAKDGSPYWVRLDIAPVFDEQGRVSNYISIETDITDSKQRELEVTRSEAALQSVIQSKEEMVWVCNADYEVEIVNELHRKTYRSLYGASLTVGTNALGYFKKHVPQRYAELKDQLAKGLKGIPTSLELKLPVADGTKYFEVYISPNLPQGASDVHGVTVAERDITEQVEREAELRSRLTLQNLVSDVSSVFASVAAHQELKPSLRKVLRLVCNFAGADRGYFYRISQGKEQVKVLPYAQWQGNHIAKKTYLDSFDPAQNAWWVKGLSKQRSLEVHQVAELGSGQEKAIRQPLQDTFVLSHISVPVHAGAELVGVLGFDSCAGALRWNDQHKFVFQILKNLLGNSVERRQAEDTIRHNEQLYRTLTQNLPNGNIALFGRDLKLRFIEGRELLRLGVAASDLIGLHIDELYQPEALESIRENYEKTFSGQSILFQVGLGDKFYNLSTLPLANDKGKVDQIMVVSQDITEQKKAEERIKLSLREKEVLLKEVHHRVKNNMQVVSGLISLQADNLEEGQAKALLEESASRIKSMAMIHEKLYQSDDYSKVPFDQYLADIATNIEHSYDAGGAMVGFHLDLDPVQLSINLAVPCGLIVNELASNAYKHAFKGRKHGSIRMTLKRQGDGHVQVGVADDGIGMSENVDTSRGDSLGLTLVHALSQQLKGTLSQTVEGGTQFWLSFPSQR